jgi:hypothetical protein
MTKLPLVRLEGGQVVSARARRPVTPREELHLIWDFVELAGQAEILATARRVAAREGFKVPEGDGPLFKTGKK